MDDYFCKKNAEFVSLNELFCLYLKKNKILYNCLKEILDEDYDMFDCFCVYSKMNSDNVNILIIIKEEYCQTNKKTERMVQFIIKDNEIKFLEGKEFKVKKAIYKKYHEKFNILLKKFYNDMYFEIINCETNIKNIFLTLNINEFYLNLGNGDYIYCKINDCELDKDLYNNFKIVINNKKIYQKIINGKYTTKDFLNKLKIKKSLLSEKILNELEISKENNIILDRDEKKFAKKKKM